ncbi:hypothetical protein EGR_06203 [Echinococcus granulosus]|uniref:Uncharacterized protein n=1 Tax=Echinococcus granulosus TaxID=6210 RepID=W6UZD1_ECHGR|nr:hypothetical protein EGR_06203 [Echinococcus granulosus]EUB58984.1 hypothetical protein EGR_06203 [Echinococcus granulosus]
MKEAFRSYTVMMAMMLLAQQPLAHTFHSTVSQLSYPHILLPSCSRIVEIPISTAREAVPNTASSPSLLRADSICVLHTDCHISDSSCTIIHHPSRHVPHKCENSD